MRLPSIQLEHPWLLLLLIPYFLVLFFAWKKRDPAITMPSITAFRISAKMRHRKIDWSKTIPFILFALAGVSLIVGLSRPRKGLELVRNNAEGIDVILVVDMSGSMMAVDLSAGQTKADAVRKIEAGLMKNRLEVSKEEITKFVDGRPDDRIGLIAFSTEPYVISPPTLDHDFMLANLKRLKPGELGGDGTELATPIAVAAGKLKDSKAKSKIVVLFTDGAHNVNAKVDPEEAARLAATLKVKVYTVGIGSGNAIVKGNAFFANRYIPYQAQFDEQLMQNIAELTGGRYYHAADAKGMKQAMSEIDKLEKTSEERPVTITWKEYYLIFAWIAAGLMLAGMFFRSTVCLKTP